LKGKLDGVAIRADPEASRWSTKIVAKRHRREINAAMKRASEQQLKASSLTSAPNVSIDFNHDPHSSTFHETTKVANGNLVRVMSRYDNEWVFPPHGRHGRRNGQAAVSSDALPFRRRTP
jgi:glyceraldehyde 3-phosphate dehydrogenase